MNVKKYRNSKKFQKLEKFTKLIKIIIFKILENFRNQKY